MSWNSRFSPKGGKPRKPYEERTTHEMKVHVPKETYKIIKQISMDSGIPESRLGCIAIDNELDTTKPFNYPVEIPPTDLSSALDIDKAGEILKFLSKIPNGLSPDLLVLSRRKFGIQDREKILRCLALLFEKKMVEFFTPSGNQRREIKIRAVDDVRQQAKRYKSVEGESLKYVRTVKDDDIDRGEE